MRSPLNGEQNRVLSISGPAVIIVSPKVSRLLTKTPRGRLYTCVSHYRPMQNTLYRAITHTPSLVEPHSPIMSSGTSEVRYTGKCLCGQIAYEVTGKPEFAGLCHCLNCKKWTGASTGWYVFFKKEVRSRFRIQCFITSYPINVQANLFSSTSASRKVKTPCAHSSTTPQTVEPPSTAVSVPAAGVRWLWVLPTTTIGLESSLGRWMAMSPSCGSQNSRCIARTGRSGCRIWGSSSTPPHHMQRINDMSRLLLLYAGR